MLSRRLLTSRFITKKSDVTNLKVYSSKDNFLFNVALTLDIKGKTLARLAIKVKHENKNEKATYKRILAIGLPS